MSDLREQHAAWCKSLQLATQADGWGQVLEAVEAYERLAEELEQALPQCYELSNEQKSALQKTAQSVDLRAKCLSSVDGERTSPTKDDMEHILDVLRGLLTDEEQPVFPLDLAGGPSKEHTKAKSSTVQVVEADADEDDDELDDMAECAVGVKPLHRPPGATYLDIQVIKVGLKDAPTYVNPTVVVSVYDKDGTRMEEPKETVVGSCDEPQRIWFRKALVQLETSVQLMEERGAAVFLEIYHYKPKKRKKSCRCWALVELDELTAKHESDGHEGSDHPAALVLELYQKPMDPKRKRVNLFTVKELYLHVQVETKTVN